MKAFLLSAGLGTRLRPLTNEIPKCLLPIRGKPLLEIYLELLSKHGVTDVLVNTHWHADQVGRFLSADYPSTIFRTYGAGADYTDQINNDKRPKPLISNFFMRRSCWGRCRLMKSDRFKLVYVQNLISINLSSFPKIYSALRIKPEIRCVTE